MERIVRKSLEEELGITLTLTQQTNENAVSGGASPPPVVKDINALSRLTQWTIKRKDWLDQRLEIEMRADEPTWLNYKPFEQEVLNSLTAKVLASTFDEVFEKCAKSMPNNYGGNKRQVNGIPRAKTYTELKSVRIRNPDTVSDKIL